MAKKKPKSRVVDAMEADVHEVVAVAPMADGNGGEEAMDTAKGDIPEPTGAELELVSSKKKTEEERSAAEWPSTTKARYEAEAAEAESCEQAEGEVDGEGFAEYGQATGEASES